MFVKALKHINYCTGDSVVTPIYWVDENGILSQIITEFTAQGVSVKLLREICFVRPILALTVVFTPVLLIFIFTILCVIRIYMAAVTLDWDTLTDEPYYKYAIDIYTDLVRLLIVYIVVIGLFCW